MMKIFRRDAGPNDEGSAWADVARSDGKRWTREAVEEMNDEVARKREQRTGSRSADKA